MHTMRIVFPKAVIADCRTDVNALCSGIVVRVNTLLRCPFLPQQPVYNISPGLKKEKRERGSGF